MAETRLETRLAHPGWAVLLAGVPLFMGLYIGPLFIDDAYITMRYAENLASGRGFVYNTQPLLGTTSPLYCLLLAGTGILGVPIPTSAALIGVISGALAPLLVWRIGFCSPRPAAGFLAALLLSLFPAWWRNSLSGMETTMAAALALASIMLYLKERPGASGAASALLVLTRPDAAALPLVVFVLLLLYDRRGLVRFAAAGALVFTPWLIYSLVTFGRPLPQSFHTKRLLYGMPWYLVGAQYITWFISFAKQGSSQWARSALLPPVKACMSIIFMLWIAGAAGIARQWSKGLVLVLFPVVFIVSMSITGISPRFWYQVPLVPAFFLVASYGFFMAYAHKASSSGFSRMAAPVFRAGLAAVIIIFISLQFVIASPFILHGKSRALLVEKEMVLKQMAGFIKQRCRQRSLDPSEVKVYVGEVGVMGYELKGYQIIDSAGINSRRVYEIRKRDWERIREEEPDAGWWRMRRGSSRWSREIITRLKPDYIATDASFLYLDELEDEDWFKESYVTLKSWRDSMGNSYIVMERSSS